MVAIHGLNRTLRTSELIQMDFSDVIIMADIMVEVLVLRVKRREHKQISSYFITDEGSVQILKRYMETFPIEVYYV